MLKSFNRFAIFTKVDNVILLSFVRQISDNKMQKEYQGKYKKQNNDQKFFDDNKPNVNEFRKWITIAAQPKKTGHYFSVLDYNILSQQLLDEHSYLYQNHSNSALNWNQRFYNLVGEIIHNNPDILCCQVKTTTSNLSLSFATFLLLPFKTQEVQKSHLYDIQARLRSLNYDVIYKKRTGDKVKTHIHLGIS